MKPASFKTDLDTSQLKEGDSDQPKHQLTVRLPRSTFRRVEFEAERCGVSLAEIVRRYLDRGISDE